MTTASKWISLIYKAVFQWDAMLLNVCSVGNFSGLAIIIGQILNDIKALLLGGGFAVCLFPSVQI